MRKGSESEALLSSLIASIECLLNRSEGSLVFAASSLDHSGLIPILKAINKILLHGSLAINSQGLPICTSYARKRLEKIIQIDSSSDLNHWLKNQMVDSCLSEALVMYTNDSSLLSSHYDEEAFLRQPDLVRKLIYSAKCLDEQDSISLLNLDVVGMENKYLWKEIPLEYKGPDSALLNTPRKKIHKRSVSDSNVVMKSKGYQASSSSLGVTEDGLNEHSWSKFLPLVGGWQLPQPSENQSLVEYISSEAFHFHQAQLDRDNAHLFLAELIIRTSTEKWNNDNYYQKSEISENNKKKNNECNTSSECKSQEKEDKDMIRLRTEKRIQKLSGSASGIALFLLRIFDEKEVLRASEVNWLLAQQSSQESSHSTLILFRGSEDWAPPRPQLILTLPKHISRIFHLEEQNYRCKGCSLFVNKKYQSTYRYCNYFGKYFCTGCHSNRTHILPASVLQNWDFKEYLICDFAKSVLDSLFEDRLFTAQLLQETKTELPNKLKNAIRYRKVLSLMIPFIQSCRLATTLWNEIKTHDFECCDVVFSLQELYYIRFGSYDTDVRILVESCLRHVNNCDICNARGFYCEICHSDEILFPFTSNVTQCSTCYSISHESCMEKERNCSKCLRLKARASDIS